MGRLFEINCPEVTMNFQNAKRTRRACYFMNITMASVFCFPPLLFATFREMYGISYTLLGTLVLVNFCTQLAVDLLFSFLGKYFDVHKTLRMTPLITATGLVIYALVPLFFPQYAYVGFLIGTFVFSIAAGLGEVLVSPAIAALPSDTPEKDMSILHSLYAYGFLSVVVVSTLVLRVVGGQYWMYLALFWAALPAVAALILARCELPEMSMGQAAAGGKKSSARIKGIILCMLCIFLGSCAENTMSNWISAYAEKALNIPKVWGDIAGMSLFAILLGITRTMYVKYGKNIYKILFLGMTGSVVCYLLAALSVNVAVSLAACVLLGICTSMLWPGTLIFMEEKLPAVGVSAYALMAAGGDFGASIAPQALGIVVDNVSVSDWAAELGLKLAMTPEQIGFKTGMLLAAVFPLIGVVVLIIMKRFFQKHPKDTMI